MRLNLDKMLDRFNTIKAEALNKENKIFLHLGCGKEVLPGFLNIDKYYDHPDILKMDMMNPEFSKGSVDLIYSSHSLEHLPYRQAKQALLNWGRLLKSGGKLCLAVPDIEEIMKLLLNNQNEEWYLYTLFGYQASPEIPYSNKDLNVEVDEGQFHKCGFTRTTITKKIEESGLTVEECFCYDGWGTPSIWVTAKR